MNTKHMAKHHEAHSKKPPVKTAGTARLTYYIFEGLLVGIVNGKLVSLSAYSGGRGGSYDKDAPTKDANNPYSYALKEEDKGGVHTAGGPIPPGAYTINSPAQSKQLGHFAGLDPDEKLPNDRGGFAIHGMGPHGSEGCIVILEDEENRKRKRPKVKLEALLSDIKAAGGGRLMVLQAVDSAFA
jgi:hypothetical protein